MPKFIVSLPDGTEITHELTEDVVTIGRVSDNTIQIDDPSVSSHHAEITTTGGHYFLKDLDSTNGTRVNGHTFTQGALMVGDRILLGSVDARLSSDNPADARPLPLQEAVAASVAERSMLPQDFSNASPFKTKSRKKDPVALGILIFCGAAVLVFLGAVISIFQLQPPQ